MYHSTAADPGLPVNVTPDLLSEHLRFLQRRGKRCCSVRALLAGEPGCDLALTFDDGYANNLDILPVLADFQAGATFFVLTGGEGETLSHHQPRHVPLMGRRGWRTLHDAGFEVAAHGHSHRRLTELSVAEQEQEIAGSIQTLRETLGVASVGYAYPYGAMDPSSHLLAKEYSEYACATRYRNPLKEDRWRLRRINISAADEGRRFGLKTGTPFRLLCDLGC
ncbi:Polysaccharide deacetylase [Thiohalorhabdus denitrificans]|uniref:Polysaccharide deacetylase n=1 Tax=Thiohalorhabdus denitrificans TaxID=381306 RepID=A0A1G5AN23_9GAMM|nr:Polysaccharide deacetylase [Thiohalorhabdus denitrificans]